MTAIFDIELQRNADYSREFALVDDDDLPLDITGATFDLDVKYAAGETTVLGSATITVVDATSGLINLTLHGADFATVPGSKQRVKLAFDWLADQDGIIIPLARGSVILLPGTSDNAA